jgi:hypothetical protein
LRGLRGTGDRAQRLDHLRALLVVGKRIERPLRLIRRKHVSLLGGRGSRRSTGLSESRKNEQGAGEEDRRQEFERHEDLFGKNAPTAKPGSASPSCVCHVGLPVFAVILCRKFAIATVFFWHFAGHYSITEMPQRLSAGNFANRRKMRGTNAAP